VTAIDREGIFKMLPTNWKVKTFDGKQSVAIAITFDVLAQLEDGEWVDWTEYGVVAYGDYWVVKASGEPNIDTVRQLAECLDWRGSLHQCVEELPPKTVVQVAVKEDSYKGKTSYKAGWMNPEDYVPTSGGADSSEVKALDARFGSLLRAAASGSKKPAVKVPPKKDAPPALDSSEIPF